ncbi:MAG: hypothetical protein RSE62_12645 [Citrobacter sp.]
MATLKEHQAAMVDLLANGSGIPASASRLAHAMHDVLEAMICGVETDGNKACRIIELAPEPSNPTPALKELMNRRNATTPGLNDKALSKPQKALKTDSPAKWPTPAEQRVKELENTIKQLKANNAKLKAENARNEDAVFKANRLTGELCATRVAVSSAKDLAERRKMPDMTSNAVNDGCLSLLDAMNSDPDFTGNLKHYFYRAMLISYGMVKLPPASIPCDHPEGRVDTNIMFCSKCGCYL